MNQNKRATRDDVARLANVSGWTVSKVINGRMDSRISQATRDRVFEAARVLGYRLNQTARALATGSTQIIAICVDIKSPYSLKIISKFQSILKKQGYRMLILDLDESLHSPQISLGPVDGFISIDSREEIERFIESSCDLPIPFVSVGVYYAKDRDHVTIDLYESSIQALTHLYDTGCRRIACLEPDAVSDVTDPRMDAYLEFINKYNLQNEIITLSNSSRQCALQTVMSYIPDFGCPDAIFCHNDDKAIGVYKALRKLGLRVPQDVSITGCDGIDETEYLDSAISTIIQPVDDMCEIAWEFLQRRMNNPLIPVQNIVLKSEFVIRESSISKG